MKEMNFNEYRKLANLPSSQFMKFFKELDGFDYFLGNKQVFRFELWAIGCRNSENILLGKTEFTKRIKPVYVPDEYL